MRWMILVAATGWTAIVGLAWWLADSRIPLCGYRHDGVAHGDVGCIVRTTAVRDNSLIIGLVLALAIIVAYMLHVARHRQAWRAAKRVAQAAQTPMPQSIRDAFEGRSTNAL